MFSSSVLIICGQAAMKISISFQIEFCVLVKWVGRGLMLFHALYTNIQTYFWPFFNLEEKTEKKSRKRR
jgi:hypothetical protein